MMKANRVLIVLGASVAVLVVALSVRYLGAPGPVAASAPDDAAKQTQPPPAHDPPLLRSHPKPAPLTASALVAEPDPETGSALADGDRRLESVLAAWRGAQAQISELQARLARVERRLQTQNNAGGDDADPDRPSAPRTPEERREALVVAGVDADLADDIIWREGSMALDRLNLRDLAVREGWVGTDRYREELSRLSEEDRSVRDEIGDGAWDRYLYNTGADNRIAVDSVIPGSAAEAAGLQAGDLIETYAGDRLFGYVQLRDATTQGEAGELVPVRIRRGSGTLDAWLPRGPLGIRMEMTRAAPTQ